MIRINRFVTGDLSSATLLLLIMTIAEAKHWPDFSCHPHKNNTLRENKLKYNKMGWESCRVSFEKYKQECDKMCILMNRSIVKRTYKNGPFNFYVDTFITVILEELGYRKEDGDAVHTKLVDKLNTELNVCKTKYRKYESMSNFDNLPCEPYNDLFHCVDKAVVIDLKKNVQQIKVQDDESNIRM